MKKIILSLSFIAILFSVLQAQDVSTAIFSKLFKVNSQEAIPEGLAFNADGTKMFVIGRSGDDVNEYNLSTGFDVATASFSKNFSIAAQETNPSGIAFNTNGTKMFVIGTSGDDVNEYNLSTGFDVTTASFSKNFSIAAQEAAPQGIAFNTDGTKMFIIGFSGDDVNEYNLSTGFDVSTASFTNLFSVKAQETVPTGLRFNSDGKKMFVIGRTGDDVNEYNLSTGFDVTTASFSKNFSIAAQEVNPVDVAFNSDGTKMYVIGYSGDDVNEYTVGGGPSCTIGDPCDDMDANTTGETYQADCSCGGGTPVEGGGSSFFTADGNAGDIIYSGGKVIVGTSGTNKPGDYKLYVEGGILTELAKVSIRNSDNWSDYVFEQNYDLNEIEEVAKFIKENKHLPNVPSAQEVVDEGIDVAKMDATLLRQIEELWLHLIELKKENSLLKMQMQNLENQN